jgi:DNA-binding MarR family transcriptional regulator
MSSTRYEKPHIVSTVALSDYRALAAFRYEIRKFLAFSERAARGHGIEPQQHQLLLAVRGFPGPSRPTIGDIAERLCVEHHTTVGLVDKLEERGLVRRERGTRDRREVFLRLTPAGGNLLRKLSMLHRDQLLRVGPHMVGALDAILSAYGVGRVQRTNGVKTNGVKKANDERRSRSAV